MYEMDLMNYLRKGMVTDTMQQYRIVQILPKKPKV
jgi:hypothetical protein